MKRWIAGIFLSLTLTSLTWGQTEAAIAPAVAPTNSAPVGAAARRAQVIREGRTICIHSETLFLTVSTLERALLKQKTWDGLGLDIIGGEGCRADLQIDVDRLHFTHIHTYVVTDKGSGIVLAAGRVRAFDGVVASGPIAEQIVKVLAAVRLAAQTNASGRGV